jgi:lysozyme
MRLRAAVLTTTVMLFMLGPAGCGSAPDGDAEKVGWTSQPVTVCAGGSTVQGIDVSEFQGSINWSSVHASGRGFAIARVSDGTGHSDPTFATNWAGIKAAGMVRGVYQFFRASEDPTAQANLLVSAVGTLGADDLPPVADVEVSDGVSGATLVANLATWVSVIKSKTGRTPMIYSAPGFWDPLPSTGQFAGEVLWVANWQVSCPDTPTPWTGWTFWQSADNGSVPGISGAVDLDEYNGTLAQLQSIGGPAPYAAQFVAQSFPLASTALTMVAGEVIPSYIELKNVGSKTWDSSTHLGTTQPRDRTSVFADSTWLGPNRPAAVKGTVPPGGTYKFQFDLQAPQKPGTYNEYFGVVEESVAWFSDPGQGGPPDNDLEVQVKVVDGGAPDAGVAHDAGAVHDAGVTEEPDGAVVVQEPDGAVVVTGGGNAGAGDSGNWATPASPGSSGGCAVAAARDAGPAGPSALALASLLALVFIRRRAR